MVKKVALLLALTFSLAAMASAQFPLPDPPSGGGNIVSQ